MLEVVRYACSDWLLTPVAIAVGEAPPPSIQAQRFSLILSGVAVIAFEQEPGSWPWRKNTLRIMPDLDEPLLHAVTRYGIPTPPGDAGGTYTRHFQVEQIASFAGLASIDNPEHRDLGFAADAWRPHTYETRTDPATRAELPNLFNGIDVDLAIWAQPGIIHRVNYHITLVGKIVFAGIVIT